VKKEENLESPTSVQQKKTVGRKKTDYVRGGNRDYMAKRGGGHFTKNFEEGF